MKTKERSKRVPMTILVDPDVRHALRLQKAIKEVSASDAINDAVRKALKLPTDEKRTA